MNLAKPLRNLIEALERLPGIGPKTAARLTFYLLHVPQEELDFLAEAVKKLKTDTVECEICHNIDVKSPCSLCTNPQRDRSVICVVEDPLDVLAIERSGKYHGLYHVLHGVIDPLNNVRPEDLRIGELLARLKCQMSKLKCQINEIILATNPSMEGEATAMYIKRQLKVKSSKFKIPLRITRLARGLPVGGDLEFADDVTLGKALEGRGEY